MKNKIWGIRIPKPVLAYITGIFASLPLIFDCLSLIVFFSYIPLFLLLFKICLYSKSFKERRHRFAYLYFISLFFFFGYYMGAFHWFVSLYPLDFTSLSRGAAVAVVLIAWIGLPLFQALLFAFCVPIWFFAVRKSKITGIFSSVIFASSFCIFEFLQTLTWAGVPWSVAAISLYRFPVLIQGASLFGEHFVSFLIIFENGVVASAIVRFRKEFDVASAKLCSAVFLSVMVANLLFGLALCLIPDDNSQPVKVAVLQANVSSREKWNGKSSFSSYLEMACEVAEKYAPDIVIMPETTITSYMYDGSSYHTKCSEFTKTYNTTLIIGAFHTPSEENEESDFTSLFIFHPDGIMGETVYNKRKLVPFGEFVPMQQIIETLIPPLSALTMASQNLNSGDDSNLFPTDYGYIGGMLCFDTIYPAITRDSVNDGAGLIAVATNDSWFIDSRAVYQHHAHSVLRAVETGRYVCVSANTGISAIISPKGKIKGESTPLTEDTVTGTVYFKSSKTLYSMIGDVFVLVCFITIIYSLLRRPIDKQFVCLLNKIKNRFQKNNG